MGVWNSWGVWNCIFSGSEFQISEPEVLQNRSFLRNLGDFLANFGL